MIVQCALCGCYYDDEFRLTFCPHDTFSANDGNNNFAHYKDSYISCPSPLPQDVDSEAER